MTKRILIVDDEEDIREVVRVSLEEFAGWLTVTATSGVEGLQIAQTQTLDAILLDISMPDMDGFQMCEELQADPKTQKIPVIVLTAKVLPNDRRRLTDLDVAGVITKPFDPMTIWRKVAGILGWRV
ncbi:response regulator [Phormidesmis priestleyi ULC007]|uniref:Response regulator n=1 Tax=Phormidesmis priestleyi ULC007 TaxID=1920490 RepID=A0A2T1DP33_9CYAN|nr:response regulator [Phormidesmis priestleyi]PSB22260.1 response regulator [Phormidesmis priestleyi ULC007]PZO55118.1 MAG: response regulator [Phormidesmis priestleyi]